MKFPVPGMGYIYLNCSSKKSYGNPPNNPGFDKTTGCPPRTDDKVLLLKRIPTQLTEHGEMELVPS